MPAPPEEEGFAGWEQLSPRGSPEPDEGFADHEGFVEVAPTPPAWPGWDDDEHLLLSPASGRSSTSGDVIIVAGPGAAGLAGLEPSPARPLDFSPGLQPGADAPPTSAAMHTIFSPGLSGADGCREGSGVGPAGDSQDAVSQVPTGRLPDTSMALAPPAAAAPAAVPRPAEQGRLGAVAERPPASPQAPASAAAASASVVVAAAASSAPPPAASPAAAAAAAAAGQRHRSPLRSRPQQALQPNEDQQRHRPGAATKAPPAPPLPIVTSLAMADLIVIRPVRAALRKGEGRAKCLTGGLPALASS